jgi:drug/metabolite transporter (DMT)-like permease
MPSVLPYLWMLLGSMSFALMATMAHALGPYCDWRVIALARTLLAMIFAAGLALAAGERLVFLGPRSLWIRSLAGSVSLVCTFFAFTHLPVSDVLTLTNIFPIWVALLSWPVLKEPLSGGVWLSVGSAVLGVALIQQPHLAQGNFVTFIALFSSFFTAVAMIGLHRLNGLDVRAIVVHFSAVALLACLASFFWVDGPIQLDNVLGGWGLVLLLGVGISATIGQIFLTKAFAAGSPAKVSVVGLTQIVFAMGLELLLGRNSFNLATLAGMGLVVVPTAWVMTKRPETGG